MRGQDAASIGLHVFSNFRRRFIDTESALMQHSKYTTKLGPAFPNKCFSSNMNWSSVTILFFSERYTYFLFLCQVWQGYKLPALYETYIFFFDQDQILSTNLHMMNISIKCIKRCCRLISLDGQNLIISVAFSDDDTLVTTLLPIPEMVDSEKSHVICSWL